MASMNAGIILAGQPVNVLDNYAQGMKAGAGMAGMQRQAEIQNMYKTHGAGIAAGDQNALNALAQFDPMAALDVSRTRQGMEIQRNEDRRAEARLGILTAQEERAVRAEASKLSAEQRAAEATAIEEGIKVGLGLPDADAWDKYMGSNPQTRHLVGTYNYREAIAQKYMSIADILKRNEPPKPLSAPGKVQADINRGLLPEGTPLQSSQVTVNTGENSNQFVKKSDEAAAARFGDYVSGGVGAQGLLGDIKALADLGAQIGTGKGAQLKAALGPYAQAMGVDIAGLGEMQAYQSIVSRLAPQMRAAGSGASSDFDAKQFLMALPSLANTPQGNEIIQQTFAAVQQQKIEAGKIASRALNGEMRWQDAEEMIQGLGDPYTAFNQYRRELAASGMDLPSDELGPKVGTVDGGYRFVGGDPSKPESWEKVE